MPSHRKIHSHLPWQAEHRIHRSERLLFLQNVFLKVQTAPVSCWSRRPYFSAEDRQTVPDQTGSVLDCPSKIATVWLRG